MVRRNVRRQHCVNFITHGASTLARRHIPQHDLPRLSTNSARSEQQLRIARKAQHIWKPFGKCQHTEPLGRLGVEKEYLSLPADRHERRPRTRCHRENHVALTRTHKRLHRQIARHRRRAIGAFERNNCRVHFVRGDLRWFAAGIFERKASDPVFQQRKFTLAQLVALRWHLRLLRLSAHFIHQRSVSVSGFDDRTVFTAGERGCVSRQIEARLFFVGVVAVRADVAENGRDVLGIRHLGRCLRVCGEANTEQCGGDGKERFHVRIF